MTDASRGKIHLAGLDFVRVLAAFGVVVMHSNFGLRAPMTHAAEIFSNAFVFAVPFFLAASLYFRAERGTQPVGDLCDRLKRLMVPYFVWSIIYLAAHGAKLLLIGQEGEFSRFVSAIPGHLLCGSAAVQLYFLPLLAVGTVVLFFISLWLSRWPVSGIVGGLVIAMVVSAVMESNPSVSPPGPVWRTTINNFVIWTGRTLPMAVAALLVARLFSKERLATLPKWTMAIMVFGVVLPQVWGLSSLPPSFWDIGIGFGWFFIGCVASQWLPHTAGLKSLGNAAGGIFLLHHLVVEVMQTAIEKGLPGWAEITSLPMLLTISLTAFFTSYLIVNQASKYPSIGRFLIL